MIIIMYYINMGHKNIHFIIVKFPRQTKNAKQQCKCQNLQLVSGTSGQIWSGGSRSCRIESASAV